MPIPSDPFPVRMRIEGAEISPKRYIVDNLIAVLQYCTFAAEHVEKNKTHPRSFDEFLRTSDSNTRSSEEKFVTSLEDDKTRGRRHMPTTREAKKILDDLVKDF